MTSNKSTRRNWAATRAGLAALAAGAALAPLAAHAQGTPPTSSVSIYGLLDVGVEYIDKVGAGAGHLTRMPSNTGTLPSRLGFRGSEDLGGGLRAVFTLEMGIAPDQGTLGQGGRGFGRQSYVGLAGPWGSVMLGRQYSMLFWAVQDSDVIGPAVYAIGSLDAYIPNSRADNALAYRGSFGAFSVGAQYSLGRDTVNAGPSPVGTNCAGESSTDKSACRQWSLMAKYDTPLWGAVLSYDTQHGRTPASSTDLIFNNLNSSDKTDQRLLLGAYVQVSDVKIGGGVLRRENDGDAVKPRSNLWYLGASYPLSSQLTLTGQVSTLRYSDVSDYNSSLIAARLLYSLSKRTAIYAQYGHIRNQRLAAVSVSGGAAGSNPAAGASQNGVNLGVRHAF
ncbi:porin [Xylophilus sp. GW821-FHT01B05]